MKIQFPKILPALFVAANLLAVAAVLAQEFPIKGKAIRVVVAFPPGIGVDAQARAVTPRLSEVLGVPDLSSDLQEGRVQMAFDAAPSAINNAKSGKAKILAVAAPARSPFLPDVPTFAEQGVKDIDIVSFLGWYGPAKMNPEVVAKINAALAESIKQTSVQENYKIGAYTAESSTPAQLAATTKAAYDAWSALVKHAGIQKQ